jgi:hypothetical protein
MLESTLGLTGHMLLLLLLLSQCTVPQHASLLLCCTPPVVFWGLLQAVDVCLKHSITAVVSPARAHCCNSAGACVANDAPAAAAAAAEPRNNERIHGWQLNNGASM